MKGINIEIQKGDFVAVMGASDSGKTTLLNILGCMDCATEGEYVYDDQVVSGFSHLKDYTLRENVEIPLRAKNIPKKKRNALSDNILIRVGLGDYIKSFPTKISGGQQQRCAIARALVTGADLILADEPTGALDSKTGQEIIDLLQEINNEGKTVIIVTHDERIASQTKKLSDLLMAK